MEADLAHQKKVVGLKQSKKAVEGARAQLAYVAADADPHLRENFLSLCRDCGVEVEEAASMRELGQRCGIEVSAAVAVLLK